MELTPAAERFVLHWGEMGSRWGVNRTVAQIHALLFIAPAPLHAEAIATTLGVARSNVSTSLRELQGWGLVRIVHVRGDRRDHFTTLDDVWKMFAVIVDERKRREIDPTLAILRDCADEAKRSGSAHLQRRFGDLLGFFETMDAWYAHVRRLPQRLLLKFLRLGDRLQSLLAKD